MIGNRVKIYRMIGEPKFAEHVLTGTLEKLDATGALIFQQDGLAKDHKRVFIPMHKLLEIVDLGRAPGF